jgi:hypothetical protein
MEGTCPTARQYETQNEAEKSSPRHGYSPPWGVINSDRAVRTRVSGMLLEVRGTVLTGNIRQMKNVKQSMYK